MENAIEAAEKAVQEQFKKDYQDSEITVSLAEKNYEVKIFPVLSLNASREIREAYRPGHGKWYVRGMDKIKLKDQEPVSLEILPKASEPEKLDEAIRKTGIEKVNTVKETTWDQDKTSRK